MKRKYLLLLLVFAVLLNGSPVLADSDFYVVAVGGGVGTKITSLPYTINAPGFYYVNGNLACASGNGITVNVDDVTIDLMGFCLTGNSSSYGILMSGRANVEIRNGTLRNWGFEVIRESSMTGANHRVINIRAKANTYGINMGGYGHLIKGCNLSDNLNNGIVLTGSGTIIANVINNCGGVGINVQMSGGVIGNTVTCNSSQTGIYLSTSTSDPILMDQNTVRGVGSHYGGGSSATVWAGKNSDNPWGSNAGHP